MGRLKRAPQRRFSPENCGLREIEDRESLSMSADATIRRLRPDDAKSFRAIRLEALKANPEAFGSAFELEDKLDVAWFAGRLENSHVMGAFRDGELVGTAGFAIQQGEKNAHKGQALGYVRSTNLKKLRRRTPVGKRSAGGGPRECRTNPVERRQRKQTCPEAL